MKINYLKLTLQYKEESNEKGIKIMAIYLENVGNVDWLTRRQKCALLFTNRDFVGNLYSYLLDKPEEAMRNLGVSEDGYMKLVINCERDLPEDELKYAMDVSIARETREKYKNHIMKFKGVTSTGIGLKEVGGRRTDEICISIGVKKKKPLINIPKNQRIQPSYDGVKTDVWKNILYLHKNQLFKPYLTINGISPQMEFLFVTASAGGHLKHTHNPK